MWKSPNLLCLVAAQNLVLFCVAAAAQEQPKSTANSIPELIQQLGGANFHQREAAHRALLSRDEAYPDIRQALPTLNAEGRQRTTAILGVMTRRRMKRFLQYGREGRVDVFVEWSGIAGKNTDSNEFWDCVIEIGLKQLKRTASKETIREWEKNFRAKDYSQFCRERPSFIREDDTIETAQLPTYLTLRGCSGKKNPTVLHCCLVVTTAPLELDCFARFCIILANGKIKLGGGFHVLAISDEQIPTRSLFDSIIATRANGSSETDSLDRRIRKPARLKSPVSPLSSAGAEKTAGRTDGLRYFQFDDLGIECTMPEAFLPIKSVDPKSPFSKAGLRPGDFIREIDGADTDSINTARRQLRRAFVLGGSTQTRSGRQAPLAAKQVWCLEWNCHESLF